MLPPLRGLLLLACVCQSIGPVLGSALAPARRQEVSATTTSSLSPSVTPTSALVITSVLSTSTSTSTTSTAAATPSRSPNDTLPAVTTPDGQLPLEPWLTPGWGVAGVILMGSGIVYALIGIKTKWLHTYMSAAYLSSLSITVLILYVMTPPIPDAIQGAYVVAVVLTGAVLGGVAVVFKEVTECLGCLLGGFTLSMWLLVLRDGGLLVDTGSKVAFIAALSLGTFVFYFSRWTRTYALIGSTSFSGATAVVLGIDAFSRAGLKEFWAYVWALNDHLFPSGTATYPMTRGIRVEIAATAVVFLAGVVSQVKLWSIIRRHREERDAERDETRRGMDEEDELAGRAIEEANAADRRDWEAAYGDGDQSPHGEGALPPGSSVESVRNEKKDWTSSHANLPAAHSIIEEADETAHVQADDAPHYTAHKPRSAAEKVMMHDAESNAITVRVSVDEVGGVLSDSDSGSGSDGLESTPSRLELRRMSRNQKSSPEPEVVPLPFKTPSLEEMDLQDQADAQSSVAAFAGDDEGKDSMDVFRDSGVLPKSLADSLSQPSLASMGEAFQRPGEGREAQVVSRSTVGDDQSSVAATIDYMSSDGSEDETQTLRDGESPRTEKPVADETPSSPTDVLVKPPKTKHASMATVATSILDFGRSPPSNESEKAATETEVPTEAGEFGSSAQSSSPEGSARTTRTKRASLSSELLPRSLSKIALSYRTNEWAKHLSLADAPEPEVLRADDERDGSSDGDAPEQPQEESVPVRVAELQQTVDNGAPPPATSSRPLSARSDHYTLPSQQVVQPPALPVSLFRKSLPPVPPVPPMHQQSGYTVSPTITTGQQSKRSSMARRSLKAPEPEPPTRSNSSSPDAASYFAEQNTSTSSINRTSTPGVVSYANPQTLMGQRDLFLKRKSTFGSVTLEPMPTIHSVEPSEASYAPSVASSSAATAVSPYGAALSDDLTLSQRRQLIMRQHSLASLSSAAYAQQRQQQQQYLSPGLQQQYWPANIASSYRPFSGGFGGYSAGPQAAASADAIIPSASSTSFNSHQPQRGSAHVATPEARQARLASFRHSISAELSRGGSPIAAGGPLADARSREEMKRSSMLSLREADLNRREAQRIEKERSDRAFDELMRRGSMLDAHREAMKKMQAGVREG